MDLQIRDKVVLITGGAKGIGEATSKACAQEGAIPVAVDRDAAACDQLHNTFQSHGWQATIICADLSAANICARVIKETMSKLGRIDALVNNAGINDKVGLEHGNPEEFVSSLSRNFLHYYNMAHYSVPHLKESRGVIVNISSKTALTGQGGTSGYVAAKAAILGMTREWSAELLPYGIRVNAVIPAEVMTPLYQTWLSLFPSPRGEAKKLGDQNTAGQAHDRAQRNCRYGDFLNFHASGAYYRATLVRGRRLCASRS